MPKCEAQVRVRRGGFKLTRHWEYRQCKRKAVEESRFEGSRFCFQHFWQGVPQASGKLLKIIREDEGEAE